MALDCEHFGTFFEFDSVWIGQRTDDGTDRQKSRYIRALFRWNERINRRKHGRKARHRGVTPESSMYPKIDAE